MKKILIPTDFSTASRNAVTTGLTIAKKEQATIILLHVVEIAGEGSFNVEGEAETSTSWEERLFNRMMIKKAKSKLNDLEDELASKGVKVVSLLKLGSPVHGIQSVIDDQKVDLVLMGMNIDLAGSIGSTTERIIRKSACPVLSVNKNASRDFKSIVLACSLLENETKIPAALREIIESDNATVHIVRVNTPALFIADFQIKGKIQQLASKLKIKKFTINIYNDYNEEAGIIHFAETACADLIAMGTHGRTGIAHLLSGSIAEDVVKHAYRPVLTFPIAK